MTSYDSLLSALSSLVSLHILTISHAPSNTLDMVSRRLIALIEYRLVALPL